MSKPLGICFLLTALALLWASPSFGQVEKGDLEISFSGSIRRAESTFESAFSSDTSRSLGISVGSRAGYFVSRHVDVGGLIGLGYTDFDDGDSYSWSIGPVFNYHFRPAQTIVPFVGLAAGSVHSRSEFRDDTTHQKSTDEGWFGDARGGADFFLNPHVAIKLSLIYSRASTDRVSMFTSGIVGPIESSSRSELDDIRMAVGIAVFLDTKKR